MKYKVGSPQSVFTCPKCFDRFDFWPDELCLDPREMTEFFDGCTCIDVGLDTSANASLHPQQSTTVRIHQNNYADIWTGPCRSNYERTIMVRCGPDVVRAATSTFPRRIRLL